MYFMAITISVLLTLSILSRWGEPNQTIMVYTEALHIEKAMLAYARRRCLAELGSDTNPDPTRLILGESDRVSTTALLNQGYLAPRDIGFSQDTELPLTDTVENSVSRNTGLVWTLLGWEQNRAVVRVTGLDSQTISYLQSLYPIATRLSDLSLDIVFSHASKNSNFAFLSAELMYDHELGVTSPPPHFSGAKRSCVL